MKTLARSLLLLSVVAGTLALGTKPAWACSCAPLNVRQTLAEVDGAFVGELVARQDPVMLGPVVGPGTSVFTFRVNRSFKGDLGEFLEVESASQGEACGLEVKEGDRIGLFLEKETDRWTSNLCLQVAPRALGRAAKSVGSGDAARAPGNAPNDTARSASDAGPQGSPVWPWVLIALVGVLAPIAFFGLRGLRSSTR
jgi:hypothetical protein